MAKVQTKKSPAPRKVKKEPDTEGVTKSGDVLKVEEISEQAKAESGEAKTTEEVADGEATDKADDGEKELVEETKSTEQAEKTETAETEKKKVKTPRRRFRKKVKKQKAAANGENTKASAEGKTPEKKEKVFSGLIFMCNQDTKLECFRHKVFGLPEAKKDLVLQINPGMKLFLFDIDLRLLYGVYEASSKGGLNLVPKAFKSSDKGFPAQVRFKIKKDSLPLSEDVFRPAIKENYVGKRRFKIELSAEQVKRLQQLFRPVGSGSKNTSAGNSERIPKPRERFQRTGPRPGPGYKQAPVRDYSARRTAQVFTERRNAISDYPALPPPMRGYGADVVSDYSRRLDYTREPGYVPADPYVLARAHLPESSVADVGYSLVNPAYEIDSLYRQRASFYTDPLLRPASKRPLDDVYLEDRYSLPVPKRAHLQDELLYRDLEYQRAAASYPDDRLLSRYYAGGPY